MAFHRKCFILANNLPNKLKYSTFSSSCFKQNDQIFNNNNNNKNYNINNANNNQRNKLSVISCTSRDFSHQADISKSFGGKEINCSIFNNGYHKNNHICRKEVFRPCVVLQPTRLFFTTSRCLEEKERTSKGKETSDEKLAFHEGMALRLVNENGFLSWCRNSYISTVAGLGMINGSEMLMAQTAGYGVLFIAGMNMIWGSGSHISNLIRLRKTTGITRPMLFLHISGATFHALLYLFLLLLYSGFFESRRRKGQWKQRKGDVEDRGPPWKESGEWDHQRRGFDKKEQAKSSDTENKI